jgi:argininosuccinate lyase
VKFDPEYVRLVLNENFEDGKRLLLEPLLAIDQAHLVMLVETGIVSRADGVTLRDAIATVSVEAVRDVTYDGTYEDLFFYIERLVQPACDPDVAGRLHTARSRNDIDMTMYRMQLREMVLDLVDALLTLRESLMGLAEGHRHTVFPAHTHTQPAQPSTVAHYLLAAIEQQERDTRRLQAAFRSVNRSPLGACAITGTGFPIDRARTSALLGFDGPTGNTYGSNAMVDYLLESAGAASTAVVGLGRMVQDLLLWGTMEVGYLRLGDGFVQTSSIMPQKRNPVALEHARALASKAFAQAQAIATTVHNTPFGDIVDTEDDLQPLTASAFRDAIRAVRLVASAMAGAQFNVPLMRARAAQHGVSITELADTLARDHGVSFRAGHGIAAAMVQGMQADPSASVSGLLRAASAQVIGRAIVIDEASLATLLSPEHFVAVRTTPGGPAPDVTNAALAVSRAQLDADRAESAALRAGLRASEAMRAEVLRAL